MIYLWKIVMSQFATLNNHRVSTFTFEVFEVEAHICQDLRRRLATLLAVERTHQALDAQMTEGQIITKV